METPFSTWKILQPFTLALSTLRRKSYKSEIETLIWRQTKKKKISKLEVHKEKEVKQRKKPSSKICACNLETKVCLYNTQWDQQDQWKYGETKRMWMKISPPSGSPPLLVNAKCVSLARILHPNLQVHFLISCNHDSWDSSMPENM